MHIYRDDLESIVGPYRDPVPVLGDMRITGFNGAASVMSIIGLDITLLDKKGRKICPWTRVDCLVDATKPSSESLNRVDGGTLRNLLYYLTVPSINGHLVISTGRLGLLNAPRSHNRKDRSLDLFSLIRDPAAEAKKPIRLVGMSRLDAEEMQGARPAEPANA